MNPKHWNLLTSEHLETQSVPQQFAAYALAYLDSAEMLCGLLARSHKSATYERGTAVLYLAQHAIELFLKGAVMRKAPDQKLGHDLEELHNRYKALYPTRRFQFDMGFTRNYAGLSPEQIKEVRRTAPPIDQLFRYPRDKKGKPWPGLYAFEANSFRVELREMRKAFERLLKEYEIKHPVEPDN